MLPKSLTSPWLFLAVLVVFPSRSFAAESWRSLGLQGAVIRDLASHPGSGRLYVATTVGGVYASDDGGRTWGPTGPGLPEDPSYGWNIPVDVVRVHPESGAVYAMTSTALYTSINAGASWQPVPIPVSRNLVGLVVGWGADGGLLIVSRSHGVWWSEDRGASWVPRHDGLGADGTLVEALEGRPEAGVLFLIAGDTPRLYRSTNYGETWEPRGVVPEGRVLDLEIEPNDAGNFLLSLDTGCFRSGDAGASWSPLHASGGFRDVYRFVPMNGALLAVGRGGLFAVEGGPAYLQPLRDFPYTRTTAAVVLGDGSLVLGTDMGVFVGGPGVAFGDEEVTLSVEGLDLADVTQVAPAAGSDVVYAACGISYDAGVFRSPDGGRTWENRSMGITNPDVRSIAVFAGNPDIVYVGTADALDDTGENGGLFRTTDGGLTWTDVTPPNPLHDGAQIVIAVAIHPTDPNVVYASLQSYYGGIFKSEDGGVTWTRRSEGLESMPDYPEYEDDNPFVNYYAMLSLAMDPADPDRLYIGAGGCWGGTYVSHDGGLQWTRRDQRDEAMEIDSEYETDPERFGWHLELFDIDVDPLDPNHILATGARGAASGNAQFGVLYESKDMGQSWKLVHERRKSDYFSNPLAGGMIHPGRPGEWVLASSGGVFRTVDGGTTWGSMNDGLSPNGRSTRSIAVDPDDPDRLYLSTALSGVWRWETPPVPPTFTHFQARESTEGVEIAWGVAEGVDLGFHVEREAQEHRVRLTREPLTGLTDYVFVDAAPVEGAVNRYWVIAVDRDGRETSSDPVEISVSGPARFALGPAYPNPLRISASLELTTAAPAPAFVRVIDLQGRHVSMLLEGTLPAGTHALTWPGRDDRGRRVTAGVYFVLAQVGTERALQKVLVLPE